MKFILGLGSNLGNKKENLTLAITLICEEIGRVTEISNFFKSKPSGFLSTNDFLNCCISLETGFSPQKLLKAIKCIEKKMGRHYSSKGYEDRIIDIDIVLSEIKIFNSKLIVPHPRYINRDFVLVPLGELTGFPDPSTFMISSQLLR